MQAKLGRVRVGAERVNVMEQQMFQLRLFRQQLREHAVAEQVGNLVPMADRMQALAGQVVGVVSGFAGGARPVDEGGMGAFPHALLPLVQQLLRHLLPEKAQVAHGRNHPQPDGAARRQAHRAGIAVIILPREIVGDGLVRQVTRGDQVRQRLARQPADAAAFREVGFNKRSMRATEFAERMQGFHHPRALRPTAAHASRERHDGQFAPGQCRKARSPVVRRQLAAGIHHIAGLHIANLGAGRQTILRQPDATSLEVVADLFVLHPIKTVLLEHLGQALPATRLRLQLWNQMVEQRGHHPTQLRAGVARGAEPTEFDARLRRQGLRVGAQPAGHMERVIRCGEQRLRAGQPVGPSAALVDGKIINHRFHRERECVAEGLLGFRHNDLQSLLRAGLVGRIKNETHAAARHAAEHPEAPEIRAKLFAHATDQGLGEIIAGPGNDGLDRFVEILRRQSANPLHVARA